MWILDVLILDTDEISGTIWVLHRVTVCVSSSAYIQFTCFPSLTSHSFLPFLGVVSSSDKDSYQLSTSDFTKGLWDIQISFYGYGKFQPTDTEIGIICSSICSRTTRSRLQFLISKVPFLCGSLRLHPVVNRDSFSESYTPPFYFFLSFDKNDQTFFVCVFVCFIVSSQFRTKVIPLETVK